MKLSSIPPEILDAAREREHTDEAISRMTPQELFHEYCEWEGLINYSATLWRLVNKLQEVN